MASSRPVSKDEMDCILMALTWENRLACEVALRTGLRIGDVLQLKKNDLLKERISIREQKTGKYRRFSLPQSLRKRLLSVSGKVYVFSHRTDIFRHRTRQAVYKDIRRAAKSLRLKGVVSPHSLRKSFAVKRYNACGDIKKLQALFNHGDATVTLLYALAGELWEKQQKGKK